jgi:hypothetical protein
MPNLTDMPALDLAIGLAFIYLLLSLFCSTVQEAIAAVLALRSKTLVKGLRNMLQEDHELPSWISVPDAQRGGRAVNLADELMLHPLIRSLYKKSLVLRKPRRPSYISPRTFALALTDTLAPPEPDEHAAAPERAAPRGVRRRRRPWRRRKGAAPAPGAATPETRDLLKRAETSIKNLDIPDNVKYTLLTLVKDARGDLDAFRTRLETWFDDSMARVSGWYKRQAQIILLVLAIVVTVALNANTLVMGDRLYKDPAVRDAVIQRATSQNEEPATSQELEEAADNIDSLAKLGVPLGWAQGSPDDPRHFSFESWEGAIHALGGWILTIVALWLGAPFWFDTLSRLSRLRSTGKPETPLPASGRGQPQERVITTPTPVTRT